MSGDFSGIYGIGKMRSTYISKDYVNSELFSSDSFISDFNEHCSSLKR